jgi:xanthine/uracil permease
VLGYEALKHPFFGKATRAIDLRQASTLRLSSLLTPAVTGLVIAAIALLDKNAASRVTMTIRDEMEDFTGSPPEHDIALDVLMH